MASHPSTIDDAGRSHSTAPAAASALGVTAPVTGGSAASVTTRTGAEPSPSESSRAEPLGNSFLAVSIAIGIGVALYAAVWVCGREPISAWASAVPRYFAGHPVAIAATWMFCGACGILASKAIAVAGQRRMVEAISDTELKYRHGDAAEPLERFRTSQDIAFVASRWRSQLGRLPQAARCTALVNRLMELLSRQEQSGRSLPADDLRDLSIRDADAAHDSLGLVRIIIWAIPMLGFLGTVIGITQTLGGLDFTSGQAAIDSLKFGLNIAFDTTALGLVLSVVAIFLQFPVERGEARLLADIDARIGKLVQSGLPSSDSQDQTTSLVVQMCEGVKTAIAESLSQQTKLWSDTIAAAKGQWAEDAKSLAAMSKNQNDVLAKAFEVSLIPTLRDHASTVLRQHETRLQSDRELREQLAMLAHGIHEGFSQTDQTLSEKQIRNVDAIQSVVRLQKRMMKDFGEMAADLHRVAAVHRDAADSSRDHEQVYAEAITTLARAVDRLQTRLDGSHPKVPAHHLQNVESKTNGSTEVRAGAAGQRKRSSVRAA